LEPLPPPGPVPLGNGSSSHITLAEEVATSEEARVVSSHENEPPLSEFSPHPRMLVVNSETFTLWKDHFARLQEVVAGWEPRGGKILTLGMIFGPLRLTSRYVELHLF
jgi:platelet-activating factor acetylhydrolase